MKIYVREGTPDSADYGHYLNTWVNAIKEKSDFFWIHYESMRDVSRWTGKVRVRPYLVEHIDRHGKRLAWNRLGAYKTLQAAILAAETYARELDMRHVI